MSVDFSADYTIRTSLGNYLLPIIEYRGDLSQTYDNTKAYYHGQPMANLPSLHFSVMGGSKYYRTAFATLNSGSDIEIYKANGDQLAAAIRYTFANTDGMTYNIKRGGSVSCSVQNSWPPSGIVYVGTLALFLSTTGQGKLSIIIATAQSANISLAENTATAYGYYDGAAIQYSRTLAAGTVDDWETVYAGVLRKISSDPYAGGGTSESGGGDGNFDFTSTDIPIPPLPTIGAYDTGFISLYVPTAAELRAMASYMWSGAFDPNNFKKLFADPMDAVLGLHIIPCTASDPPTTPATLMIGNISTGLTMPRATAQYYELDCGTISIPPKWGAYLDYSPYSKLSLYLPYIGFVPISPDDCMRGSIRVVYHVDILSGSCVAFVYCVSNRGLDGHTLYSFTGALACDCPITEGQYTNAVLGILGIAGSAAGMAGKIASANVSGAISSIGDIANSAISMAKPEIGRSGGFGGAAGLMGIQYPYLVLTVPRMCTPEDQNVYLGYPSLVTTSLGDIAGYAKVEVTHLAGMTCTEEEAAEILELLHEGVIF